jgi:hypothetical protein
LARAIDYVRTEFECHSSGSEEAQRLKGTEQTRVTITGKLRMHIFVLCVVATHQK